MEEAEVEQFCEDLQDLLELTPNKDVLFILEDWNAQVGTQETPGVTGKFGLGVQNEAGQRLIEFFGFFLFFYFFNFKIFNSYMRSQT